MNAGEHTTVSPSKSSQGIVDKTSAGSGTAGNVGVGNADLPDDEKTLKRIWLTLLPTEQVIEILLKLDESLAKEQEKEEGERWGNVRREVWPTDLKAAVLHAAVARIVESGGTTNANANGAAANGKDAKTTTDNVKQEGGTANGQSSKSPPPPTESSTTATVKSPQPTVPTSSTTLVPPLIPIRRPSPPTSRTTYQAAASASASYPYQPYSSGSLSYHQQSYTASSPTLPARIAIPPTASTPPAPTPAPAQDDEDDLPSYEEMLVQALTVHTDPEGTAPKQLFQWMAATYPLQANFRPSASQALQKAYKRGRFEKNSEGRYRLNPRWEGGNTSRRTTRRPQSYSKSVMNPSPSSHPPPNSAQFPPQHYTWTYGGRAATKSESPAPGLGPLPPFAADAKISSTAASLVNSIAGGAAAKLSLEPGATTVEDHESHRSCMEAAYSILQALNITGSGSVLPDSTKGTNTRKETGFSGSPTTLAPTSSSSIPSAPLSILAATSSIQTNRAALQGSLALLAAQLAELADICTSPSTNVNSNGGTAPTQGTQSSLGAAGLPGLGLLEGMGININFNLDLARLGLEVEPAK